MIVFMWRFVRSCWLLRARARVLPVLGPVLSLTLRYVSRLSSRSRSCTRVRTGAGRGVSRRAGWSVELEDPGATARQVDRELRVPHEVVETRPPPWQEHQRRVVAGTKAMALLDVQHAGPVSRMPTWKGGERPRSAVDPRARRRYRGRHAP
jgi:hypothetical protein